MFKKKKKHTEYIQFTIGTLYSNEKQMRFHRHPVKDTWIYFKVEEVGQKSVHNYMNALCPQGNARRWKSNFSFKLVQDSSFKLKKSSVGKHMAWNETRRYSFARFR